MAHSLSTVNVGAGKCASMCATDLEVIYKSKCPVVTLFSWRQPPHSSFFKTALNFSLGTPAFGLQLLPYIHSKKDARAG
jgi:hypothetical protein